MKKGFGRGFLTGLMTAALAAGLCITALAANRTITIDDGIRVTINGAAFVPRDAKGAEVPLFTYEGTTYAPVRAICEAAGMKVGYDSATRTAVITTSGGAGASANYITADKAKEIALKHAGIAAADVVFLRAELDWDDGRAEYEVEFYAGNTEYDYDIDAISGEILTFDHDIEHYQIPGNTPTPSDYITADRAKEIALGRAPAGTVVIKCELDWDDGRAVYEIELRNGYLEYDCEIDAVSGAILSWDVDD